MYDNVSPPETENSCKVCCRGNDGTCSPFMEPGDNFLYLRKGKPCTVGYCDGTVSHLNPLAVKYRCSMPFPEYLPIPSIYRSSI